MDLSTHMLRTLAVATTVLAFACAPDHDVSPEARAWIESASAANQTADRALESGDRARARTVLEDVLRAAPPRTVRPDDRRIVLQDVRYRLASIDLEDHEPESALEHSEAGLALGRAEDVFTANLHVTRGRALEAIGREVEAADAYFEALEINDALLRQMLDRSDESEEP
jgi:predicted negative regulator of RcsB-dependent stress response